MALSIVVLGVAQAAPAAPDLTVSIALVAAEPGANLTAGVPARAVATVSNTGNASAVGFEVDMWVNNATNVTFLPRHSVTVSDLAAGAQVTLHDNLTFVMPWPEQVFVHAIADPADRVADANTANNHVDAAITISPPAAQRFVQDAGTKLSSSRTLPAFSFLAFRLEVRDGDSIIFQADSVGGALFDCYLFNNENFTLYYDAREKPNATDTISFLNDYSRTKTDHIAFTSEPIEPGTYYLVLENDERLQRGATPDRSKGEGKVEVTYAVALVNNSIPPIALAVVIGAAAAAIWATVRWRPHFDVRSPLLEVDSPDPAELDGEPDGPEAEPVPEMDQGEGPPPHPP